ncbi:MAG: hypothetical protein R3D68_00050 [Hyphomicrobiaceae bacterium]
MISLSFDTDHMSEDRMLAFLGSTTIPGRATFFCTNQYACLSETRHELAPHPYLGEEADWPRELSNMRRLFPDAKGWRSHSCVYSHILAEWVGRNGYQYVSTQDNLGAEGIEPIRETFGVWQVPIYYMDNLDFSDVRFWGASSRKPFDREIIVRSLQGAGLYVFDFHPIHLMLNSPSYEFYAAARDQFKSGAPIDSLAFTGYGARSFFDELVNEMLARDIESATIHDCLSEIARA